MTEILISRSGLIACARLSLCVLALASISILSALERNASRANEKLLARIEVLAKENKGLEARITRKALRRYCQIECGSCIPTSVIINALTRPNPLEGD